MKTSAVASLTALCCKCSKRGNRRRQIYFGVAGLAAGLFVGGGVVIDGGTFVASATGCVTRFVLAPIAGTFVPEGAVAGAVNGAVGMAPGPLSCLVNVLTDRR